MTIDIVLQDFWSPIVMFLVIILTGFVVYLLYRMGNPDFKRTEHKGEPFISANRPPEDIGKIHVGGDNVFWGFIKALENYFEPLIKGHTGIVNDYMYWIVCTLAVVLVYLYFAV
uniref:Membrane bound hydrogenase subunit mbhI n=1 Tax=uncultured organism TaxID=155900 RepID=M1Q188_9ZZZZ|nr:membrane bound hydrogenase subunit mbhI [uncultured organism]